MSNLSNLMISGSYYGLINLQDSTQNLASQSGDVQLQDGVGDNIGLTINATTKEFTVVNNFKVDGNSDFNGDVDISGSLTHTGSIDIVGDLTIQGDVTANVGNFDTVNARLLNITEESASVIFSSGSNVLGDEETDRQDLIGQVIVSGTLSVEGNSAFTGSLTVSNEISSSTINGIGNVTSYSASVDSRIIDVDDRFKNFTASYYTDSASFDNRIDQLELDTGSQDSRLDSLEAFTGSQETINGFYNQHTESLNDFTSSQLVINGGYNTFTSSYYIDSASFDLRLDQQEAFSSSLVTDFVTDSKFNPYTASIEAEQLVQDGRLNNLELVTSSIDNRLNNIELTTSSLQVEIDGLSNKTGSYATTGSNTFNGNQDFSGSVRGEVNSLTISSETASIDCSEGNFFTLQLVSGSTHINATNINGGETITLELTQPSNGDYGTIATDSTIIFPEFNQPSTTNATSSIDVMTFVSFGNTRLLGVMQNNFQ
jgi:hypothetical protein